jgi:hypothetical protein
MPAGRRVAVEAVVEVEMALRRWPGGRPAALGGGGGDLSMAEGGRDLWQVQFSARQRQQVAFLPPVPLLSRIPSCEAVVL